MPNVIQIPGEPAWELDLLAQAGHKRRTPYAVDLLSRDVGRSKQRQALKLSAGSPPARRKAERMEAFWAAKRKKPAMS